MLAEIERETLDTESYTGRARLAARVLRAMDEVPRHEFVPAHLQAYAYDNAPLPIGHGQTISQPYIVALMTDLLDLDENDVVLEIGTGCGYQTAVLARLAQQVFSIEIVEPLAAQARSRLARLPFDAIILTASPPRLPPALLQQLAEGGRLVAPLSREHGAQELVLMRKDARGQVTRRDVLPVAFVPLTGADTVD